MYVLWIKKTASVSGDNITCGMIMKSEMLNSIVNMYVFVWLKFKFKFHTQKQSWLVVFFN